jgi:hypothetical protein
VKARRLARVMRLSTPDASPMEPQTEKPGWVDTLEESLLLAIVLFSLITWIVMLGVLLH